MARKKVRLAWIANDSAWRSTFKKRRKGLMKKASELSTLCDIQACAIVYGPYEPTPEVWPSPAAAAAVLDRFRSLPQQGKKTLDQVKFTEQRVTKAREQLKRAMAGNRATELAIFVNQCLIGRSTINDLDVDALCGIRQEIDACINAVQGRLQMLESSPAVLPLERMAEADVTTESVGREMVVAGEMEHYDQGMEMVRGQELYAYNPPLCWLTEDLSSSVNIPSVADGYMPMPYLDAATNSALSNYYLWDYLSFN